MQLKITASPEEAKGNRGSEFDGLTHIHTWAHKCPSSPQPMQCVSLFCMDNRWEQKWPGLSASPSCKETLGRTVPGHRGRGWLLCGEDVASSQVKSNFVSRKFHLHFLLPPSHLAPLRHADNSNMLACTGHLLTPRWLTYICLLLPPSWIAVQPGNQTRKGKEFKSNSFWNQLRAWGNTMSCWGYLTYMVGTNHAK